MSGSVKLGLTIIAAVVVIGIVAEFVKWLMAIIIPIAIVASVGLILYGIFNRKAIGGNRKILR